MSMTYVCGNYLDFVENLSFVHHLGKEPQS